MLIVSRNEEPADWRWMFVADDFHLLSPRVAKKSYDQVRSSSTDLIGRPKGDGGPERWFYTAWCTVVVDG